MFNVTILKMRDLIKYFIEIVITLVLIVIFTNTIKKADNNRSIDNEIVEKKSEKIFQSFQKKLENLYEVDMSGCLNKIFPLISNINEEDKNNVIEYQKIKNKNILEGILQTQLASIKGLEESKDTNETNYNKNENIEKNENNKIEEIDTEEDLTLAQIGLNTEIITNNPIAEAYNTQYGKVKIKNETEFNLTEDILRPDISIENKNILIFHTHTCESYTSSEKYSYIPTGNFRTTDLNYTVVRVGNELENYLKKYNYNVIHNTNYHDYPAYNGSYTRSLATVQSMLNQNPSDIIIDLHRDAIGSRSDYAPIVKIGDEDVAAQIMFVIGTDGGGLYHPNWNQNLKFAIKIQEKAEELYPGLFKPIILTNSRYNQHTGKYANIIEVGATGNTLEQCLTSMKYLSKIMEDVIN